ncbi:hypothetical protein AVEN_25963-1 [Araneus ventricosus]|uniref:Uncharacterized protein n=1 Tax=Araneus ventricosus TaxID=182803 RepID=A0A4Y2Q8L8_ARAVE|nr:hypothetical protein AVEN_25963-1 [Araneus ventricosus]
MWNENCDRLLEESEDVSWSWEMWSENVLVVGNVWLRVKMCLDRGQCVKMCLGGGQCLPKCGVKRRCRVLCESEKMRLGQ